MCLGMTLPFPKINFLTNRGAISFFRRALLRELKTLNLYPSLRAGDKVPHLNKLF